MSHANGKVWWSPLIGTVVVLHHNLDYQEIRDLQLLALSATLPCGSHAFDIELQRRYYRTFFNILF